GSPAARREFRGSGRTSCSGVLSPIIRRCEKPRHYKGAVVTSPPPTHPKLRMGRLFVRVSALRDREPLHTLAPVGFEDGDHLSLWDFARRPVEQVRNCSARAGQRLLLRAVVPFTEKTCRSAKGLQRPKRSSSQQLRLWAESTPTGVVSRRTGVRAKAAVRLRARNRLHRPERKFR